MSYGLTETRLLFVRFVSCKLSYLSAMFVGCFSNQKNSNKLFNFKVSMSLLHYLDKVSYSIKTTRNPTGSTRPLKVFRQVNTMFNIIFGHMKKKKKKRKSLVRWWINERTVNK